MINLSRILQLLLEVSKNLLAIILNLDFSGLTSGPKIPSPQPLTAIKVSTPVHKKGNQKHRAAFKVKIEDAEEGETSRLPAPIGTDIPGTEPWRTRLSFDSDQSKSPERRSRIFKDGLRLDKRSKSCEGHLRTPPVSSPELHVPLTAKSAKQSRKPSAEDKDDPEIALSRPRSPVSPETDSSDDDDHLFDTPRSEAHESYGSSTPLTPPSVYKTRNPFIGDGSPSPAERKSRRPAPIRFANLEEESGTHFSGHTTRGQKVQKDVASKNTSVKRLSFEEGDTERKTREVHEEREPRDIDIEGEIDDSKIDDDNGEHRTTTALQKITTASHKPGLSVKGIDVLRSIFGDKKIEEGLDRCGGMTYNGKDCKKIISKATLKRVRGRLEILQTQLPFSDLVKELYIVAEDMFCFHHFVEAKTKAVAWVLSQGVASPTPKPHDDPASAKVELLKTVRKFDYKSLQQSSGKSAKSYTQGTKQWIPYQPKYTTNLSVRECLAMGVVRSLKPREERPGFLYVYITNGDFGSRKIGVTEISIEKRLKKWKRDCQSDVTLVYPKEGDKRVRWNHVFRLEKLIHLELKDYRIQITGCICTKTHIEWSQAPEAHILAVISRWTTWIESKPYELQDGRWQLKKKFLNIEEICTPCLDPTRNFAAT
ncbi:hypothetical protein MMC11_006093 [Xylographa trunciseda]|nr:hypothetical protein [Xylographa trunciseda]